MEKAPDAFRTISEAAAELDVPQHVLRFWETRFSQVRPMKRAGGRRYYRPQDIDLLRGIRRLLYDEGYTIKGVQKILREHGIAHVIAIGRGEVEMARPAVLPVAGAAARPLSDAGGEKLSAAQSSERAAGAGGSTVTRLDSAHGVAPVDEGGGDRGTVDGALADVLRVALEELEGARSLLQGIVRGHEELDQRLAAVDSDGGAATADKPAELRTSGMRRG